MTSRVAVLVAMRLVLPGAADSVMAMPKTLDQSVEIAAPAGRVWELVSTSEGLSGWFVDATVVPGPQGAA